MNQKIRQFLDQQERVKQLPSKNIVRKEVFRYLSSKFEADVKYTEKEVNRILTEWSTTGDYFMLRRGLIDNELLGRTADGSQYWKNPSQEDKRRKHDGKL